MKILSKINVDVEEVEMIQQQLRKLEEMEQCLSDYAVWCYEIFRTKDTIFWIRVKHVNNKLYTVEIIREEQS